MNLFLLLYVSNNCVPLILNPFIHWKPTASSSRKIVEHFWAFDYKLANRRTLTDNTEQGYQVLYLSHTSLLQNY